MRRQIQGMKRGQKQKLRLFGMFNEIKGLRGNNLCDLKNLRFLGYGNTRTRAYGLTALYIIVCSQNVGSDAYEKSVDYLDYLDY
jgi:hypothetical protein